MKKKKNYSAQTTFTHYFTEEEERKLFKTINRVDDILAKRDYFWMLLMRKTGIRLSILAGPDPKKIKDAKEREGIELDPIGLRVIDAKRSLDTGYLEYRKETNKGSVQYPVRLKKEAIIALKGLLNIHNKMTQGYDLGIPHLDSPLLLSRNRGALSRRTYQTRMRYWCKEADVTVGTPHWWRHTLAKRLLDQSDSPKALRYVQSVLGHSNLSTTGVYTTPSREEIDSFMRIA